MSFAARLIHSLTIVRTVADPDNLDAYGQPISTTVEIAVQGLVQPKTAKEMEDFRSAGTEIGDNTIFLAPRVLNSSDSILYGDGRYQIMGIRRFEFGRSPHLEVDARRIGTLAGVGS
jgi:hypothetical protein